MNPRIISGFSAITARIEKSQESTCVQIVNCLLSQKHEQLSSISIDWRHKELPTVLHYYQRRGYDIVITPLTSFQIDHITLSTLLVFQTDEFLTYYNDKINTLDAFFSQAPVLLQDYKMIKAAFTNKGLPIL